MQDGAGEIPRGGRVWPSGVEGGFYAVCGAGGDVCGGQLGAVLEKCCEYGGMVAFCGWCEVFSVFLHHGGQGLYGNEGRGVFAVVPLFLRAS